MLARLINGCRRDVDLDRAGGPMGVSNALYVAKREDAPLALGKREPVKQPKPTPKPTPAKEPKTGKAPKSTKTAKSSSSSAKPTDGPSCGKRGVSRPLPKGKGKGKGKSSTSPAKPAIAKRAAKPSPSDQSTEPTKLNGGLVRRTNQFVMNGPPVKALIQERVPLSTEDLGGCSVILIASNTHAYGIHCSRGAISASGAYTTPVDVATSATKALVNMYKEDSGVTGKVKAMIITADQENFGDETIPAIEKELVDGGIADIIWYPYDAKKIFNMPAGQGKKDAGKLTVQAAGHGLLPQVHLGLDNQCLNFSK